MDCLFCTIVADHRGSEIVWDDDHVLAFLDINPVTDGHTLIIPKEHADGLDDLPAATAAHMMTVAQRLARSLKESSLPCAGVNLFFADGRAAFQEIFHAHLHLFPRFAGDGFMIDANWEGSDSNRLHEVGTAIRSVTS